MRRLIAVGDLLVILLFAFIGRASHHESGGLVHTLVTALPFLIGWVVAAIPLGAYDRSAFRSWRRLAFRTARAALVGGLVALAIRSTVESRLVPFSFAVVALMFLVGMLVLWRTIVFSASRSE